MRFSLSDGTIPLLTTKQLAWRTCFRELMWFISGNTDNRKLQAQNVHIWDANASREFLDKRGLINRKEGDLGPIYSHQWRHFGAEYIDCETDYSGEGVDQLATLISNLKDPAQRDSRRLILCSWNVAQIEQMALPPCHCMAQFHVSGCGKKLSCSLYQRSGDVGLGVPFNIASYSFLTHILANHCGLEAHEFILFLGDAHIYAEHLTILTEQSSRKPLPFPKIRFTCNHIRIEDYNENDVEFIKPYYCLEKLAMKLVP